MAPPTSDVSSSTTSRCGVAADRLASLDIDVTTLRALMGGIQAEARRGLARDDATLPLKMLPSYVRKLPDGTERGQYLALDLGGTNFRVCLVTLHGADGKYELDTDAFVIPDTIKTGDGAEMFDFVAKSVAAFVERRGLRGRALPLGFTFSYPTHQTSLASGTLIAWTKGFTAANVVGNEVVAILQAALRRAGVDDINVVALVNDTVGTLVAQAYRSSTARIGVILGTGTNAAVALPVTDVHKVTKQIALESAGGDETAGGRLPYMLLNCEWGAFDPWGVAPPSAMDRTLDTASSNPTQQRFEKLISGLYLGELARLAIVDVLRAQGDDKLWPSVPAAAPIWTSNSLTSADLSTIDADAAVPDHPTARGVLVRLLAVKEADVGDAAAEYLQSLATRLADRAAGLSAAGIAALVGLLPPNSLGSAGGVVVGIDGSVWLKFHRFQDRIRAAIVKILGNEAAQNVQFDNAPDGSGVGAALIAALAKDMAPSA